MAFGVGEQLEAGLFKRTVWNKDKPWQVQGTAWRRYYKTQKARSERRRAKQDPECQPWYKRFKGWEY